MKPKIHRILSWAVVGLSVLHIGAAPAIFSEIKSSLAWFIGVGLMGLFLAFLNFIAARSVNDVLATRLTASANGLAVLFACGNAVTDPVPQTYVVIALFVALALSAPTVVTTSSKA
ncbi:MAG: hypothetical protein JNK21_15290 [Rhodospirillaceae bacterium]|nr:hypothetical protein [Rhodospirillaceae bacterium]